MKNVKKLLALMFISTFVVPVAMSQTAADTLVTNTATVDFEVGGVAQTQVSSNTAEFRVDRSINFTLVRDDATYVSADPGSTTAVLAWTITNTSNDVIDFNLLAVQQATNDNDAFGGQDDSDATAVNTFVDSNNNGVYDVGVDLLGYVDELASGSSVKIFVLPTVSGTAGDGDIIGINLQATAAEGGVANTEGTAFVADTDGDDSDPLVVETLFAEGFGDGGDASEDGQIHVLNALQVASAELTIVKTSQVLSDPVRGTTNPLRIPGAVVEWTITVTNNGSNSADSVVIADPVTDPSISYATGSIALNGVANDDNDTGGDETPNGADFGVTTADTVTANFSTVAGSGGTATLTFNVTID